MIETKATTYIQTPLEQFAFWPRKDDQLQYMATQLAAPELWEYTDTPNARPLPILHSYIQHTFKRIKEEYDGLSEEDKHKKMGTAATLRCFNTGLYTANYEEIFGLFTPNTNPGFQPWALTGFYKESDAKLYEFEKLPERANYFQDIGEIVFDARLPIRINLDHVLDDIENFQRLPEVLRNHDKEYIRTVFTGTLGVVKKKLAANYKLAVPQYYAGRVQLLIPMSLTPGSLADVALAINREGANYVGHTCLTLDMAYNNARLIVKPESDWLKP